MPLLFQPKPFRRLVLRATGVFVLGPLLLTLLNEFAFAYRTIPHHGEIQSIQNSTSSHLFPPDRQEVKILAYNIAKAFVDEDLPRFTSREKIRKRLGRIADVIRAESPDLIFLSEVVWETPYNSINQVQVLAQAAGYRYYAFGENSNLGLPFFRYVGGNAILSRWPLSKGSNPDLIGRQPFWITRNNRRALMVDVDIRGTSVRCVAAHLDSFHLDNNLQQVTQILETLGDRPAIVAGDFNAWPGTPSLQAWENSRTFSGAIQGPNTIPSHRPDRRIDYILAPKEWKETFHGICGGEASDHLAVVSIFQLPGEM